MLGIFDYDLITYQAGFAGETRRVEVVHIPSGRKTLFKNKTEFRGRGKKVGGWLGEVNAKREEAGKPIFDESEFTIETVREVEPLENVLSTTKRMIRNIGERAGISEYCGYLGKGNGFRYDAATLWEYKGNRKDVLRPLLKDEIAEYILKHQKATLETFYEADDRVIMKAIEHGVDDSVVITIDKDSYGCPVRVFNPDRAEEGIVDCRGFGEIYRVEGKSTIRGKGRMHLYWQVAHGDDTDNYKANCFSDIEWGAIKAYESLKDCQTDKEAFESLMNTFKNLYPEEIEVEGWRGDLIRIDWLYVLEEMWNMARMRRHEDDVVFVKDILKGYKML